MSSANDTRLRETFEKHRTILHDARRAHEAVAAKDRDFMQRYVAHRNGVIAPTLQKLKKLAGEYGHVLLIDNAMDNESPEISEEGHLAQAAPRLRA